ncbi:MAG: hypothetical protein ABSH20_17880 [Tepidisphaeraceae bacterium]|jgi:hypothetical protein
MAIDPKPFQQTLEIRYERGYRYLDRCGEVMLILEDVLAQDTGKFWMTDEPRPTGGKIKCPELDVTISLDSSHMVVQQEPMAVACDFLVISASAFAVVSSRFGLETISRAGQRTQRMIATDSADAASKLAVKHSPFAPWPKPDTAEFCMRDIEATSIYESADRKTGIRWSMQAVTRLVVPIEIDPRLRLPTHLLPKEQDKVLKEQLARRSQRDKDPAAGLMLDSDYYWVFPDKFDVRVFLDKAKAT